MFALQILLAIFTSCSNKFWHLSVFLFVSANDLMCVCVCVCVFVLFIFLLSLFFQPIINHANSHVYPTKHCVHDVLFH